MGWGLVYACRKIKYSMIGIHCLRRYRWRWRRRRRNRFRRRSRNNKNRANKSGPLDRNGQRDSNKQSRQQSYNPCAPSVNNKPASSKPLNNSNRGTSHAGTPTCSSSSRWCPASSASTRKYMPTTSSPSSFSVNGPIMISPDSRCNFPKGKTCSIENSISSNSWPADSTRTYVSKWRVTVL